MAPSFSQATLLLLPILAYYALFNLRLPLQRQAFAWRTGRFGMWVVLKQSAQAGCLDRMLIQDAQTGRSNRALKQVAQTRHSKKPCK